MSDTYVNINGKPKLYASIIWLTTSAKTEIWVSQIVHQRCIAFRQYLLLKQQLYNMVDWHSF